MSLNVKNTPVGIDINIQNLQTRIYNYLGYADSVHNSYGRVYIQHDKKDPFAYIGNNEYKEVKLNDNFGLTSFFTQDGEISRDEDRGDYQANISFVTFSILDELKQLVTHRADEEFVRDIVLLLEKNLFRTQFTGYEKGLNAISELFGVDNIKLSNTQPYHVTRFRLQVNFNYSNC